MEHRGRPTTVLGTAFWVGTGDFVELGPAIDSIAPAIESGTVTAPLVEEAPREAVAVLIEAGPSTGTMSIFFQPGGAPGPGDINGPRSIEAADGDFSADFVNDGGGVLATFSGEIRAGLSAVSDQDGPITRVGSSVSKPLVTSDADGQIHMTGVSDRRGGLGNQQGKFGERRHRSTRPRCES